MKIDNLLKELESLNLPNGEYAVFGSAVMAVRGIREAPNIDVIVTNNLWNKLSGSCGVDSEGFIRIGSVKISNWWFAPTQKSIPTMILESETIKNFPFVRLEDVRFYKNNLAREKDKQDVKLIDDFLNSYDYNKEPVALSLNDYQELISLFLSKLKFLETKVVSVILFGSVSRGEAKGSSDIDIFVVFDQEKISKKVLAENLVKIVKDLRISREYKSLVKKNIFPEIYHFLISKKSIEKEILWVFLDAVDHGKILMDKSDFSHNIFRKLKEEILASNSRRSVLPNGKWCWLLKNNFKKVMEKSIPITSAPNFLTSIATFPVPEPRSRILSPGLTSRFLMISFLNS